MPVLGIGGLFFRARDPGTLSAWCREHLGVGAGCDAAGQGVSVKTRAEWDAPEIGRFARIHDPEGNAIELWEPPA